MKSFNVKRTVKSRKVPLFTPSWWKRLINYFRGLRVNPIFNWWLTIEVDSVRGIKAGDIFIGQSDIAWEVLEMDISDYLLSAGVPMRHFMDIKSIKPQYHANIIGPAVVVVRASGEYATL